MFRVSIARETDEKARQARHFVSRNFIFHLSFLVVSVSAAALSVDSDASEKLWERSAPLGAGILDQGLEVLSIGTNDFIVVGSISGSEVKGTNGIVIRYSGENGGISFVREASASREDAVPRAATTDAEGNLYVVADSSRTGRGIDIRTAKHAANDGRVLWGASTHGAATSDDRAAGIATDPSGDVFVAGSTTLENDSNFLLIKYQSWFGGTSWQKSFGSPEGGADYFSALVVDEAGNVALTGSSNSRFYTAKFHGSNGVVLWEKRVDAPGTAEGVAISKDHEGNFLASGTRFTDGSSEIYVVKYAGQNGAVLWERSYSSASLDENGVKSMAVTQNGDVLLGGYSDRAALVLKYCGSDGVLAWEKRINGQGVAGSSLVRKLIVDSAGDLYLQATLSEGLSNPADYVGHWSVSDGSVLWSRTNLFNGFSQGMIVGANNDLVITGYASNSISTDSHLDVCTARYSATDGSLVWKKAYDHGVITSVGDGTHTGVDARGNVIVSASSSTNHYIAKYAQPNGQVSWQIFDERKVSALKTDLNGDVVMTGVLSPMTNVSSSGATFVAKRSGENGAVLWERVSALPGVRHNTVTVDDEGNITSGVLYRTTFTNVISISKHRSTDGQQLWQTFHTNIRAAESGSVSLVIVLDHHQNPVVAGSFNGSILVAKQDGNNGAVLWRWEHPGLAPLITVDRNGDLLVADASEGGIFRCKLSGRDGTVIWHHLEPSAFRSIPRLGEITLDPSGSLIVANYYFPAANSRITRYGGNDGALIWEHRFGEEDRGGYPEGLFADASGDVLVGIRQAPRGPGAAWPQDFSLLKLSGNDGALLSELKEQNLYVASMAKGAGSEISATGGRMDQRTTILFRDEPRLRLLQNRTGNLLKIEWPSTFAGLRLEALFGNNGVSEAGWHPVQLTPGTNTALLPIQSNEKAAFYRLVRP